MSADNLNVGDEQKLAAPIVDLNRIKKIVTYEVMDNDLDALQKTSDEEQLALGFATASLGTFAGALCSWPTQGSLTTLQVIVSIMAGVFTVWYGITWAIRRRHRMSFIARIREEKVKPSVSSRPSGQV